MSYDPALPADQGPLVSAVMRSQLQGLKALLDTQSAALAAVQSTLISMQNDIGALQSSVSLLQAGLNDTARNPATVSPGTSFFSDPMTASDGNNLQAKLNELLAAIQRV